MKSSPTSSSPCLSPLVAILSPFCFWVFILCGDRMMIYQSVWYWDSVIKTMAPWQYYISLLYSLARKDWMIKHSSIHHTLSYTYKVLLVNPLPLWSSIFVHVNWFGLQAEFSGGKDTSYHLSPHDCSTSTNNIKILWEGKLTYSPD